MGTQVPLPSTLPSRVTPKGLIGVSTPAEVGGIGGTFIDEMIVCEEMSYRWGNHTPACPVYSPALWAPQPWVYTPP